MLKVLFVCTGNTCRSSMAEAVAKKIIAEKGWGDKLTVASAGVAAVDGLPASPQAVAVMEERGIDLRSHRSRMLKEEHWQEADVVLTMTESHKAALQEAIPGDKLFTLAEFVGLEGDIADPIGGSEDVYRRCADRLEELVARALEKLMKQENGQKKE